MTLCKIPKGAACLTIGILIGLLLNFPLLQAEEDKTAPDAKRKFINEIIDSIKGESPKAVWKGIDEYEALRDQLVESLILVSEDNANSIYSRGAAIYLMGEVMRTEDAKAIKAISNMINKGGETNIIGDHKHINCGTPVNALVSIGRPAMPELIINITESDDKIVIEESIWVIYIHFRIRKHTYEFLEKLNKKYKDKPEVLERLEIAKKKIDSYKYPGGYKEPLY